jgi:glycosyltransferase involved in cell wall biosynthesis
MKDKDNVTKLRSGARASTSRVKVLRDGSDPVPEPYDAKGPDIAPPAVSIIIPVYNEEGLLATSVVDLIDRMQAFALSYELILTENGSVDDTLEIAYALERRFPQVRVLHSSEPNYGKALRRGILAARGTWVLADEIDITDTDFYRRALEILTSDQADMVVGSKLHRDARDKRPPFRRMASHVINGLLRVFLDFQGTDTHGLKAFHRDRLLATVNQCLVDKDLFASEFVIRAERSRFRVFEIPVEIAEKRAPSIKLTKRVPNVLKNLAKLVWYIRVKG